MSSFARSTIIALGLCVSAFAGGPIEVGGPSLGAEGVPFTWDLSSGPIQYRVDGGPMASRQGTTVVDNATGVSRVNAMFNTWSSVSNASLQFQNAGAILPAGAFTGGDVDTLAELNDVKGSCDAGQQSPVIFDADGSMLKALNVDSDIIGITFECSPKNGSHFVSAIILLNGVFQDGVATSTNEELTASQFDEAITHEIGHLSGLDHAQINLNVLSTPGSCSLDDLAGLPLMFPYAVCQSRASAGLPTLSPDDIAWISFLYPSASFQSSYGFIEGEIRFSDGITPVQGVNVIARRIDDPSTPENESKRIAVSVVSGYLFTDRPGQSITGDSDSPSPYGSRQPNREGYFKIPVTPGQWTVEVESIAPEFTHSSGVGPLRTPVPNPGVNEFYDSAESASDDPAAKSPVIVTAGHSTTINIILNGTQPRFDSFEDESRLRIPDVPGRPAKPEVIA